LDHPDGEGRRHQKVSDLFELDNTRPRVADLKIRSDGNGWRVQFSAADPEGAVAAVEMAVDGGQWRSVTPLDGVADSGSEPCEVWVEALRNEEGRSLQLRVTDAAGNLGGNMKRLSKDGASSR
ncbi:MAG: hypothetical protein OEV00_12770, partial [Acidobacteriota bacterium]|nr:hypothetical protein [Acidobacteriota bacterium]